MTHPTHSVIMPVLNGKSYVLQAIESVLSQLSAGDEIIVIDNGSTDGTPDLVAAFSDRGVRLLYEARRGPAAARNLGLRHASGDFISFLDHDDMWPKGRHLGLQQALNASPDADAAHGRLRLLFEREEIVKFKKLAGKHVPSIFLQVYLFRRELVDRVGSMDDTLIFGEDTDYLIRLRAAGMKCVEYDGEALIHRRHGSNLTGDAKRPARGMMNVLLRNIARRRAADRS